MLSVDQITLSRGEIAAIFGVVASIFTAMAGGMRYMHKENQRNFHKWMEQIVKRMDAQDEAEGRREDRRFQEMRDIRTALLTLTEAVGKIRR